MIAFADRSDAAQSDEKGGFTIGEMARFYNVSLRTLRFYEQFGLLAPQKLGLQRLYSAKDRARFELVLRGRRLRLSLSEIRSLIDTYAAQHARPLTEITAALDKNVISNQIAVLERQRAEIEQAISELKTTGVCRPIDDEGL